jgi:hypothetical protein
MHQGRLHFWSFFQGRKLSHFAQQKFAQSPDVFQVAVGVSGVGGAIT